MTVECAKSLNFTPSSTLICYLLSKLTMLNCILQSTFFNAHFFLCNKNSNCNFIEFLIILTVTPPFIPQA